MIKSIFFRYLFEFACLSSRTFFFSIIMLSWALSVYDISSAGENKKISRILYINSYSAGYSWSDDIEKGIVEHFKLSDKKIELSVEYLDSKRFKKQVSRNQQVEVMHTKYAEYHHEMVIVSDNNAFSFAMKNRQRLSPDIPVIFCGYNAFRPDVLKGLTNITGVNEEIVFIHEGSIRT